MAPVNQRHPWPVAIVMTWPFSSSGKFDGGTRVAERITDSRATAAGPMTTRAGVKAHIEMLAGIRRHFESA
jgi:hypothetical protein